MAKIGWYKAEIVGRIDWDFHLYRASSQNGQVFGPTTTIESKTKFPSAALCIDRITSAFWKI
jgi:hypothetical protein